MDLGQLIMVLGMYFNSDICDAGQVGTVMELVPGGCKHLYLGLALLHVVCVLMFMGLG